MKYIKRILSLITIITSTAAITACSGAVTGSSSDASDEYTSEIFAMDTYMSITAYGEGCEDAVDKAVAEVNRLDALFSVGNADSDVVTLNAAGSGDVSDETAYLIEKAVTIGDKLNGAFDVTIYPVMDLWGFTTKNYHVPSDSEIAETLAHVSYKNVSINGNNIVLSQGSMVDLGGIAKGYTSQRLMEIFEECGIEHAIVNLGGNVQVLGNKTDGSQWRIAVQKPDDEDGYLGILSTQDKAVITSGGYERYFEEDGVVYHHIIDPETGYPADSDLTSVTIVCSDGTTADALSTGIFVMGLKKAEELYQTTDLNFEMILYGTDGNIYITEGIADDFTTNYNTIIINK